MIMSKPAACQTTNLTASRGETAVADLPAQRVWLLERRDQIHGSRFAGGVIMLADQRVYFVVVISHDPACASQRALLDSRVRIQPERDALKCCTLDDALAQADHIKGNWIDRGWTELEEEPLERTTR